MKNPALATVEPNVDGEIVFLKSEKRRCRLTVEEKLQYVELPAPAFKNQMQL